MYIQTFDGKVKTLVWKRQKKQGRTMQDKKARLVTRADFDGIVSGGLLIELGMIDDVMFAEPRDMQAGKVTIGANDITTNLPYVDGVRLCFDHHVSESERVGPNENHIIVPDAPSAARVVYDHFGGEKTFPAFSKEAMNAVDQADSARYSEEDILAPGPWTLLNFILDPRTGLSRFDAFSVSHADFMKEMMVYVRHHPIEEILAIPDVEERVYLYLDHAERFEMQLRTCTGVHDNVVVVDLRQQETVYAGNRFAIYALYPEANVSIQILPSEDGKRTIFAVGKSIIDRTAKTNVGLLMLEHGGGGHAAAGTCQIEAERADAVLADLIRTLTEDG